MPRKGIIIFYILTLIFFIFKGFKWAKLLLGITCFIFTLLLIPLAIFQIYGQLENPSNIFSKIITFVLTIGLPAVIYMVMGFVIMKSRIIAFIDSQKIKIKNDTGLDSE